MLVNIQFLKNGNENTLTFLDLNFWNSLYGGINCILKVPHKLASTVLGKLV